MRLQAYRRTLTTPWSPAVPAEPDSAVQLVLSVGPVGASATVRTILGVEDASGSLRFTGNNSECSIVRLMRMTIPTIGEHA